MELTLFMMVSKSGHYLKNKIFKAYLEKLEELGFLKGILGNWEIPQFYDK